ncbi:hypothetical protein [Streptomyces sp. NPDC057740]|uniref:hypothetical protein n=1 Tax=Streptomyces sp. NPDC057740 TaxID=3346234 RepID=UPI0036ACE414
MAPPSTGDQISISYLHHFFEHEEETVAASIRHQRLDHARRDLADPAASLQGSVS